MLILSVHPKYWFIIIFMVYFIYPDHTLELASQTEGEEQACGVFP